MSIYIFVNNQNAMKAINNTSSGCKNYMVLNRILVLECMKYNVNLSAKYIPSCENKIADAISRSQWSQFKYLIKDMQLVIRLDFKPKLWENKVALFCAYLVDNGRKSATIKLYISAIKSVLKSDGYEWDDTIVLMNSLTKACKLVNDRVYMRLPVN